MPKRTVPPADKARILELARTGMSRRQISVATGWSSPTVSRICVAAGLPSAVTLPEPFVKARALSVLERQVAARERKLEIDELYDAQVLATLRDNQGWTTRKKGKGGAESFVTVDKIPADDYRNITGAAASLASAFKSYAPLETGTDTTTAESVVDTLMDGFKTLYRNATQKDGVEGGEA